MRLLMEDGIKRWTAKRKSALALEFIQGKTTMAEASRRFDLPPSKIENQVDQGKGGMENARRAKPEDVREQYERKFKKPLVRSYGLRQKFITHLCRKCWAFTGPPTAKPAAVKK